MLSLQIIALRAPFITFMNAPEPHHDSIWEEGWRKTRRILGVLGLGILFAAELIFNLDVPIYLYTTVWGLLGLGELVDAINTLGRHK